MRRLLALSLTLFVAACATAPTPKAPPVKIPEEPKEVVTPELPPADGWALVEPAGMMAYPDDDIQRHRVNGEDWANISIHGKVIKENGYSWNLLRFTNTLKPNGPLWVIPHDDENAAFDAMLVALRTYGGVAVVVNSGPGTSRNQSGYGPCGVEQGSVSACDPNRNFDSRTPLFTAAIMDQWKQGQPIIALHTNKAGFAGDGHDGGGQITMLDIAAARRGENRPARNAYFGNGLVPTLNNYDSFPLMPFRGSEGGPDAKAVACRNALNAKGIHFWHERVDTSDGSLSNYLVLNRPQIAYINIESRQETDLKVSADRHLAVLASMWELCGYYFVKN